MMADGCMKINTVDADSVDVEDGTNNSPSNANKSCVPPYLFLYSVGDGV